MQENPQQIIMTETEDENMEKKNEMKPLDEENLDQVNGGRSPIEWDLKKSSNTGSQPNQGRNKPSNPKGTGYGRNGRNI